MTARGPLLGTATWTAVMEAAGYVCACTGQCGSKHTATKGRCDKAHYEYGSKDQRLSAVPIDPAVTGVAAMQLPRDRLTARCHKCQGGVLRLRNKAAKDEAADVPGLFDVTPEGTPA